MNTIMYGYAGRIRFVYEHTGQGGEGQIVYKQMFCIKRHKYNTYKTILNIT